MKKWVCIFLMLSMVMGLVGCGQETPETTDNSAGHIQIDISKNEEPTNDSQTELSQDPVFARIPELPMPEVQGPELGEGVLPLLIGKTESGSETGYFFQGWDVENGCLTDSEFWFSAQKKGSFLEVVYWNGGYDVWITGEVMQTTEGIDVRDGNIYMGAGYELSGLYFDFGKSRMVYMLEDEAIWETSLPEFRKDMFQYTKNPSSAVLSRVTVDGEYGIILYKEFANLTDPPRDAGRLICCKWRLDDPAQTEWFAFEIGTGHAGNFMVYGIPVYADSKIYATGNQAVLEFDMETNEMRELDETNLFSGIWNDDKGLFFHSNGVFNTISMKSCWNDTVIIYFYQDENGESVEYYMALQDGQLQGVMTRNCGDNILRFYNGQMEYLGCDDRFCEKGINNIIFAANR